MTNLSALSARLREAGKYLQGYAPLQAPLCREAADALDAAQHQADDPFCRCHACRDGIDRAHADKIAGLKQRVEQSEARIAEYLTRPWPGCRMLSEGSGCDCSLCQAERRAEAAEAVARSWAKAERDALRAALEKVRAGIAGGHTCYWPILAAMDVIDAALEATR